MFEQIHQHTLSFSKQLAQNLVRINHIAVDNFEKSVDLQLKHLDTHLTHVGEFTNELFQVRDLEALKEVLPKTVHFGKQSAELGQVALKDLFALVGKAGEQFTQVVRSSADEVASEVGIKTKTTKRPVAAAA